MFYLPRNVQLVFSDLDNAGLCFCLYLSLFFWNCHWHSLIEDANSRVLQTEINLENHVKLRYKITCGGKKLVLLEKMGRLDGIAHIISPFFFKPLEIFCGVLFVFFVQVSVWIVFLWVRGNKLLQRSRDSRSQGILGHT